MIIGFTGTQEGMTEQQKKVFRQILFKKKIDAFIHGDCIGADDQAASIFRECIPSAPIIAYPCNIQAKRANNPHNIVVHAAKPPLDRNKDIVKGCTHMVATPKEMEEQLRSGTWSTVRFTLKIHKPLLLVFPNGVTVFKNLGEPT